MTMEFFEFHGLIDVEKVEICTWHMKKDYNQRAPIVQGQLGIGGASSHMKEVQINLVRQV